MNFGTANTNGMANTQVDGIERYCGRVFVANSASSGVAATRSVCSKYFVKVPILKECHFGKMKLCRVEHFHNILVFTFGRDCYCIHLTFFQNWYFSKMTIFPPSEEVSEITFCSICSKSL